jgi:Zn-dependent peptidase ImmA (M78 family)/transcriptional regulator with XRE-family HTH domain
MESDILQFEPTGVRLIPARLKEAREAKGYSMTELANLVGVTPQAISQYESDDKQPEWSTLVRISGVLEQSISYFTSSRPDGGDPTATAFFRSFKSRTKSTNKMLRRWSVWGAQVIKYIGDSVNLPPLVVPDSNSQTAYIDDEIERYANRCRRLWGLADGPIANMVALLESKGFIVIRSEFGVNDVDAFSCWQDGRPFIFLATDKDCAVRSRFDAAHELGHMILHRHLSQEELEDIETLNRIEREANRFAAAFLLPAKTFVSEIFSSDLRQFIELKRRWKVAIAAMIYRCKDLGVFDDTHYINLRKQISFHKWIKKEPLDDVLPVEQTQLISHCVKLIIDSRIKAVTDFLVDLRLSSRALSKLGGFDERIFEIPETEPGIYHLALKKPQSD